MAFRRVSGAFARARSAADEIAVLFQRQGERPFVLERWRYYWHFFWRRNRGFVCISSSDEIAGLSASQRGGGAFARARSAADEIAVLFQRQGESSKVVDGWPSG